MTKVLVIDDEKIIRERLKKLLRIDGFEAFTASDGPSGLKTYSSEKPDIVLADIRMPGMDGLEILKQIKEKSDSAEVIMITGHGSIETAIKAMKEGAFDYIEKPINYDELEISITRALDKRAINNKLKEREEQFRKIAQTSNDAILITDSKGKIVFWNSAAERIFGYSEEQATGMYISSIVSGDMLFDHSGASVNAVSPNNTNRNGRITEHKALRSDGIEVPVEISTTGWESNGEFFFSALVRDISERKEAEDALRASEEKYRLISENVNDLIVMLDSSGKILYCNDAVRKILGYTPEELINADCFKFAPPDDPVMVLSEFKAAIEKGDWINEAKIERKDGSYKWIESSCKVVRDIDGSFMHVLSVSRDITERKQVEDALRESEDKLRAAKNNAESANRAKSIFLANMSHEIRTPLNSLLGFAQFLEMQQIGSLNDKQIEYVRDIRSSGEHLLEMVNDILDLAKIEAGKIEIQKKPFDLNLMLSRSPTTIESLARKKGIRMEVNIQPGLGTISADEVRIKQIIYNLLSNAIKFTEPGKCVGIEACGKNDTVVISVWDQGKGIREEDLDRIFFPFEQARGETVKPDGTGLGLSISRRLVDLHNGKLEVQSKVGEGSRFTLTLPGRIEAEKKDETMPQSDEASTSSLGKLKFNSGIKVLVVEDNDMNQKLFMQIFKRIGLSATYVKSGEEVLKLPDKKGYRLILMDIHLPGIDGVETMKKIREEISGEVPIIAITAYAMKGDREKFMKEGFSGYISKPIDIDKFAEVINGFIN